MFFNRQAVSEGSIKLQTVQQLIKYFYPPPVLILNLTSRCFLNLPYQCFLTIQKMAHGIYRLLQSVGSG